MDTKITVMDTMATSLAALELSGFSNKIHIARWILFFGSFSFFFSIICGERPLPYALYSSSAIKICKVQLVAQTFR